MKYFSVFIAMLFMQSVFAQNQHPNNSINIINNDDGQIFALNNQQKLSNTAINFQINKPSFDLPQESKPQLETRRENSRSTSPGLSSGRSAKSNLHRTIKRVSSKSVVKHFDKKVKNACHYKKKSKIKKCASFL